MRTLYQKLENGICSCDEVDITVEQWKVILADSEESVRQAVFDFLRLEGHAGSCTQACLKYEKTKLYYNSQFNSLAQKCAKNFGFEVKNDNGENAYWLVPMEKGEEDKKGQTVKWNLRKELVQAAQDYLLEHLIDYYIKHVNQKGSLASCNEIYKWRIVKLCENADILDAVTKIDSQNLIYRLAKSSLQKFGLKEPGLFGDITKRLFNEDIPLKERISNYAKDVKNVWDKAKYGPTIPSDEGSASYILTCKDPYNYTFYMYSRYTLLCDYLGIAPKVTPECVPHYLELLKGKILPVLTLDEAFLEELDKETSPYLVSRILNAQDVLWQGQDYMKESVQHKSYYLADVQYNDGSSSATSFFEEDLWQGVGSQVVTNSINKVKCNDVILFKSTDGISNAENSSAIRIVAIGTAKANAEKKVTNDKTHVKLHVHFEKIEPKEFTEYEGSYRHIFDKVADESFIKFADDVMNSQEAMKTKDIIPQKIFDLKNLLHNAGQVILQGAPGTGKTYITKELAVYLCSGKIPADRRDINSEYKRLKEEGRISFTTFHQSLDYEEFVEGLKPDKDSTEMRFTVQPGIFKRLCDNACKDVENAYILIIDEINRANISKVLGELITLLEPSKRLGKDDEVTVTLPYSGEEFGVPSNLYIIGTMNTADRSVGYIDYAIRRRFAFMTLTSDASALKDFYGPGAELHCPMFKKEEELLTQVRIIVKTYLNRDFDFYDVMLGHSYFMAKTPEDYNMNLEYKIIPLLKEYLRDGILVEKGTEVNGAIEALKELKILR